MLLCQHHRGCRSSSQHDHHQHQQQQQWSMQQPLQTPWPSPPSCCRRRLQTCRAAHQQQQQQRSSAARPASAAGACFSANSSGGSGPGSTSSSTQPPAAASQQQQPEPWDLMGREVKADRLALGQSPRSRLELIAAARQAGTSVEFMERAMQELLTLLPDLASLLPHLSPAVLAPLAADTGAVARKLVELRLLFPSADVGAMVSRRPTLLLDEQFDQVAPARAKLLARLAATDGSSSDGGSSSSSSSSSDGASAADSSSLARMLDGLVTSQPLLLVADVDSLLDELERLLPAVDVAAALQRDPGLVAALMSNRHLSLW